MTTWIEALANHIQTNSLGTKGTNLFIGMMPDVMTLTTVLTQYSGNVVETQSSGAALFQPRLQIRTRGAAEDYLTPYQRLTDICNLLNGLADTTINGVHFLRVKLDSTINSLGEDNNLRFEFSANLEVTYVA